MMLTASLLAVLAAPAPSTMPAQAPTREAATWTSELYPERPGTFGVDKFLPDFSHAGYAAGERPLPAPDGPYFDVVDHDLDPDDATGAINRAIAAAEAAGGGVVRLPAGTLRLKPDPDRPEAILDIGSGHVILRGAGSDATFLLNEDTDMRSRSVVRFRPSDGYRSMYGPDDEGQRLTADLTRPTTRIPLAEPEQFAVGDLVQLANTITPAWAEEHNAPMWAREPGGPRGQRYVREVVAVGPDFITIDAPIHWSLLTRDDARVRHDDGYLHGVGIEGLSMGNLEITDDGPAAWDTDDWGKPESRGGRAHGSYLVVFDRVIDGFARDVHSFAAEENPHGSHMLSNGIAVRQGRHITIADCDLRRPQYGGAGGNGYMYRLQGSDCLVRDSSATFSRHGYVISHMQATGNVMLRCTDRTTQRSVGSGPEGYKTSGYASDHHMWMSHANLADACTVDDSFFAAYYRPYHNHLQTATQSVFWNTTGVPGGRWDYAVHSQQFAHGYVIGTVDAGVRTDPVHPPVTDEIAAPIDHVEGVNEGATLSPASLYEDQLRRRLARGSGE